MRFGQQARSVRRKDKWNWRQITRNQTEEQKEKEKKKKTDDSLKEIWAITKLNNIKIMGDPERQEKV